ncbi:MAG: phosphoribosylformylglycinamidine cyclo-ligase [Deltaproteobacteria bacterium]|nr:phosphoribosylformylglycinamidine cyclo-ligase [Deltaproteobacteria bacterium]
MGQTYKKSGVDIDAGDHFVDLIAPMAKSTYRSEVLGGIGPFAASFALDLKKYKNPILISSTDGVGTKLKLAIELKKYDTIGQDLVAMCVNDLICCGGEPLFFLDYFAVGKLKPKEHASIVGGIAKACKYCNCSLIGGETAEMPGLYHGDDFDLAGFAVGAVEKDKIIDGKNIGAGDVIIGVASSGVHSNGYSLVRKIMQEARLDLNAPMEGKTLGDILLEPTKLYPPLILSLLSDHQSPATSHRIKAIAHITGGGLMGNVPRVIPDAYTAVIDMSSWKRPAIFNLLQEKGGVAEEEMRRVFNLGIGLVLVAEKKSAEEILRQIATEGELGWLIGEIA